MTTEELDDIDGALRVLVVPDGCSPGAKRAALRFNSQLERERSRLLDGARAGAACAVSAQLEVELRGAAIMYRVARERVVRLWRLPLRPPGT